MSSIHNQNVSRTVCFASPLDIVSGCECFDAFIGKLLESKTPLNLNLLLLLQLKGSGKTFTRHCTQLRLLRLTNLRRHISTLPPFFIELQSGNVPMTHE
jgi:hypothetical protein